MHKMEQSENQVQLTIENILDYNSHESVLSNQTYQIEVLQLVSYCGHDRMYKYNLFREAISLLGKALSQFNYFEKLVTFVICLNISECSYLLHINVSK